MRSKFRFLKISRVLSKKPETNGAEQNVFPTPVLIAPTLPLHVPDEHLDQFLETISEELILPRSAVLSESQPTLLISTFASQQKLTINQAKTVMAVLFQSGGTTKGCGKEVPAYSPLGCGARAVGVEGSSPRRGKQQFPASRRGKLLQPNLYNIWSNY